MFSFLQSNSLLVSDSLRGSDKRRNGPDYSNDLKKRKVEDKDSSHYVSELVYELGVCSPKTFLEKALYNNIAYFVVVREPIMCSDVGHLHSQH